MIRTPFPHSEELPPGMSQSEYTDQRFSHLEHYIPRYVMSADNIAGVLVEPALAEGGNWVPDIPFIKEIRDICDRNDWLMIAKDRVDAYRLLAKLKQLTLVASRQKNN